MRKKTIKVKKSRKEQSRIFFVVMSVIALLGILVISMRLINSDKLKLFSSATGKDKKICEQSGGICMKEEDCSERGGVNAIGFSCTPNRICCNLHPTLTLIPTEIPTDTPTVPPTPLPTNIPTPTEVPTKRIFVTSTSYTGNLGGVDGADGKCQLRADAAGLGGNWKAWLSDTGNSVLSRLTHNPGPYVRIDGTIVANNWEDLTTLDYGGVYQLKNDIRITELGTVRSLNVYTYTNTLRDGSTGTSTYPSDESITDKNCSHWLSSSSLQQGGGGAVFTRAPGWTEGGPLPCSSSIGLYCLEQ